jgi:transposase-like protein
MARPSTKTPEEKRRVDLAVLRAELSAADAGRRNGVAEQTTHNWKKAFLDAGRAGLSSAGRPRRSSIVLQPTARRCLCVQRRRRDGPAPG